MKSTQTFSKREPLLSYHQVSISVKNKKQVIPLTEQISFCIYPGEVFGLIGESGSGKSISAYSILGLYPQPGGFKASGEIYFEGKEISSFSSQDYQGLRSAEIAMIYQEPGAALNPLMKIKDQMDEVSLYHPKKLAIPNEELLEKVGFPDHQRILRSYPHELSGGMQQRVMIAMALKLRPRLLIADEPTTALDVTIQKQVMDLLLKLQKETVMALLFITHNLALISQYGDRLAIMSKGKIVEELDLDQGLSNLKHPYSQNLLASLPKI